VASHYVQYIDFLFTISYCYEQFIIPCNIISLKPIRIAYEIRKYLNCHLIYTTHV